MTAPCEYAAEAGGRLVINQAGLSGHYEFDLEFLPDDVRGIVMPAEGGAELGVSIFTSIQRVGLKWDAQKLP